MPKKILIVDDDPDIVEIFQMIIEANFQIEILTAGNEEDAEKIYNENKDFCLVICDYSMPGATGAEFFQHVMTHGNVPFFLTTGHDPDSCTGMEMLLNVNPMNRVIPKPINEASLVSSIKSILETESQIEGDDAVPFAEVDEVIELKKIRIEVMEKYIGHNPDLYLKISDNKFVKVFNKDELHSIDELLKYKQKGEQFCYVNPEEFRKIHSQVYYDIRRKLTLGHSPKGQLNNVSLTMQFLHDGVLNFGITADQIEIVDKTIDVCVKELSNDKNIAPLIDFMLKDKGYLVFHSINALLISHSICKKMLLSTNSILEKLAYASLLHDLALTNHHHSEIFNLSDKKIDDLTVREKESYKLHPFRSSELAKKIDKVPSDVLNMIVEHHERPDGGGFPKGQSAQNISTLGSIFILSLKVADFFYYNHISDVEEMTKFKSELLETYDVAGFKAPMQIILECLK